MNDPELVDEARRWLRFSSMLLAHEVSSQAAEKVLKAALVLEEIDFPFRWTLGYDTRTPFRER